MTSSFKKILTDNWLIDKSIKKFRLEMIEFREITGYEGAFIQF